jgi:hypothetical protein
MLLPTKVAMVNAAPSMRKGMLVLSAFFLATTFTPSHSSALVSSGNLDSFAKTETFTLSEDEIAVAAYVQEGPTVISDTHPDENNWYRSRNVTFSWNLPARVTAVRTLYDAKPSSFPNRLYDPPIRSKSFVTDEDGVMYMHVQWKDEDGWGTVSHRKFQIDTTAPKMPTVTFPEGDVTTNTAPTLGVEVKDELSGIDHISLRIDGGEEINYPYALSNTYKLPRLKPGKHALTVLAYDKASNRSQAETSITIRSLDMPLVSYYTKQAEYGKPITVQGTTYPGMTIEVMFTDEDRETKTQTTKSDSEGNYSLTWAEPQTGVQEMSVRVTDQNGATSPWTEGRLIVIEGVKLIRIGMFIMNWLSLALILILASMLVVATFWYSFLQFNRFRRKIHRTLKEAEATLKMNVQALRRDTEEFHTILVKAEKKRDLTKEEQAILRKFKKRLDTTEKEIEKKLEQIG